MTSRVYGFLGVMLLGGMLFAAGCSKPEESAPVQAESSAQRQPTVNEVFRKAEADLREGRVEAAIAGFSAIIKGAYEKAPERAFSYAYLGQIAYRAGKMDLAIENLNHALNEQPALPPQVRMTLGNAYFQKGEPVKAIASWEELLSRQPNLPTVRNNVGVAYMDLGELDRAIQAFEQAIAITPDHVRAHENLADAYDKKGLKQEAEAARRKAAAIRLRRDAGSEQTAPASGDESG
ncbi:MAG: tetratricopeptide repeat protein [Nitrospirota bacterium]|nr:tetratricopeptide repeat protein [Nitrospirota bacterium]